jgi:hypothetical protein
MQRTTAVHQWSGLLCKVVVFVFLPVSQAPQARVRCAAWGGWPGLPSAQQHSIAHHSTTWLEALPKLLWAKPVT